MNNFIYFVGIKNCKIFSVIVKTSKKLNDNKMNYNHSIFLWGLFVNFETIFMFAVSLF